MDYERIIECRYGTEWNSLVLLRATCSNKMEEQCGRFTNMY